VNAADDLAVLARVVASLVVVVALAVLAARFARRAGVRGGGTGLQVVERTGLTREASIAVVEVADRALVVGVTPHGVTLLAELEPGVLEARRAREADAGSAPAGPGIRPSRSPSTRSLSTGERPPGTGSVLDPRTWRQAVEALRELTVRRR
jgi:flagellar biosynthetic protein FliO